MSSNIRFFDANHTLYLWSRGTWIANLNDVRVGKFDSAFDVDDSDTFLGIYKKDLHYNTTIVVFGGRGDVGLLPVRLVVTGHLSGRRQ